MSSGHCYDMNLHSMSAATRVTCKTVNTGWCVSHSKILIELLISSLDVMPYDNWLICIKNKRTKLIQGPNILQRAAILCLCRLAIMSSLHVF